MTHGRRVATILVLSVALVIGLTPLARAALETSPFAGPGLHPRGSWSGFENHEAELGKAVAKAIMEASPSKAKPHDFAGREAELGRGVATVIRTLNVTSPYQHETNDALVKMTLNYIQFAKDHNLVREMLEHEIRTEMPMLSANRKRIADSGDPEIALMAVTERTACFYQLAIEVKRAPGEIRYKSPFGRVLAMTRQLGQHTLTEKEIHEVFTVPRLMMEGEKMGVDFEVSPLADDGWITIRVKPLKAVAG